jgi:glycosyltransferase involved in cell wall biosynthesis
VVIPCFNYEAFVGSALQSVLDNDRQPDEVIVVDDGSTDRSADVAAAFDGVRVLRQPNTGMAGALNAGIAAATGDIIVLLDADDTSDKSRLAWIEQAFADPAVCMAWHPLRITTLDGAERGILPHTPLPQGDIADALVSNGLTTFAVTSGIAIRRNALDRVGPIPEDRFRASAEAFLVRTLPFVASVASTDQPLGVYRSHPGSDSRRVSGQDYEAISRKLRRRLRDADNEHALLAEWAARTGRTLSTARLRSLDPVYLTLHRQYVRLTAAGRWATWREGRSLELDPPRHRHRSNAFAASALLAYCVAPKRFAASMFLIRGDYERTGILALAAKIYWTVRGAALRLAARRRRARSAA